MGHPYAEHRQTKKEHSRVSHITKGYKSGGAVHGAKAIGKKALALHREEHAELHAEGGKSKHRMDRPKRAKGGKIHRDSGGDVSPVKMTPDSLLAEAQRRHDQAVQQGRSSTLTGQLYKLQGEKPSRAKGGKVKGKHDAKTIINVVSGGHPAGGAIPAGPPMAPPAPPMGIVPATMAPPPMAAKPPMMPPGAGAPPSMPMRERGGKIHRASGGKMPSAEDIVASNKRMVPSGGMSPEEAMRRIEEATQKPMQKARGGKVTKGTKVFEEGQRNGTPVQHMRGKGDLEQMGRGKQVTFESGGRVRSFYAKGGSVKNHTDPGVSDRLHMGERFKASPMEIRGQDSNTTNDPTIGKPNRARGGMCRANGGMADKVAAATKLPGGSGGGEARLAKAHREARR